MLIAELEDEIARAKISVQEIEFQVAQKKGYLRGLENAHEMLKNAKKTPDKEGKQKEIKTGDVVYFKDPTKSIWLYRVVKVNENSVELRPLKEDEPFLTALKKEVEVGFRPVRWFGI